MNKQGWLSLFLLWGLMSSHSVIAGDESKLHHFVEGCNELVQIYKTRGEQRLLAAQTTSLSEALRAGYCRGVIDSYKDKKGYRCSSDWFEMASYVAHQLDFESKEHDIESLLERSCR